MKRQINHITFVFALVVILALTSCTQNFRLNPGTLLEGESPNSTVISTLLLSIPVKMVDATIVEVEHHFQKKPKKQNKEPKQKKNNLSIPIHTRITSPIHLKKDSNNKKIDTDKEKSPTNLDENKKQNANTAMNAAGVITAHPHCCQILL